MSGRNGADRLGLTLLWTGLILYILGTLIGTASGTFWMLLGSLLNLAGFRLSQCLVHTPNFGFNQIGDNSDFLLLGAIFEYLLLGG